MRLTHQKYGHFNGYDHRRVLVGGRNYNCQKCGETVVFRIHFPRLALKAL